MQSKFEINFFSESLEESWRYCLQLILIAKTIKLSLKMDEKKSKSNFEEQLLFLLLRQN